jgi:hypothetical protein
MPQLTPWLTLCFSLVHATQVYQGLTYKMSFAFPNDYPFKAPTVKFETPCFHPNVDQFGNICLDILKEKWSAVYNVRTILLSIQSLLGGELHPRYIFAPALRIFASTLSCCRILCVSPFVTWFRKGGGVEPFRLAVMGGRMFSTHVHRPALTWRALNQRHPPAPDLGLASGVF